MKPVLSHRLPGAAASIAILALLATFIAVPIGAVLRQSVVVSGPMPIHRLKAITEEALRLLPEDRRASALERWVGAATEKERLEAMAAAFRLAGRVVPWDTQAAFERQSRDLDAALAGLDPPALAEVERNFPIALAMLHKRMALAFQVRDKLPPEGFDLLRAGTEDRLGLDHYLAVLEDPYLARAALNSLALAVLAAGFTVPLAFSLAYAINRGGVPRPGLVRGIVLLPLVAPPVLVATATLMLFGRRGLVTHALLDRGLGLIDADSTNLYGALGVVVAQTLSFMPAATIVLDNVLRKQDGRIEEAAASLGASRWGIFREVTLPMAWPGIKRALILVAIMSLTDFGNPLILGRDTPVLAGIVYDEMTAFRNTPLAAALCVWMILPSLLAFLLVESIGRRRRYEAAETTGGAPELALPLRWRVALTSTCVLACGLIVAIYATMALGSVTRTWGVDWTPTLGHFMREGMASTLSGMRVGTGDRGLGLVWDSLRVAGIAGPLGGLLGIAIAYVVDRIRPPGRDLVVFLSLVPAMLPGIVLGIGYIVAFNLPFGIAALSLTGGSSILVVNILFSNVFVGVLAGRAALQRMDPAVDEAAAGMGAGIARRFFDLTLPMLRSAFLLGALYVFVDGMTTFSSVIFLVSGDHNLASVAIFNHANAAQYGAAAAQSMAILAAAALAMAAIWALERRLSPGGATRGPRPPASPGIPGRAR